MPRRPKGPRLYLRKGRIDNRSGRALPDLYYIRDGQTEVGTCCGPDRLGEAEQKLADYIAEKWAPEPTHDPGVPRNPGQVFIAEVIAHYLEERAPHVARPQDAGMRGKTLLEFWGERTLADVRSSTCAAYVKWRTSQPLKSAKRGPALERRVSTEAARRELEDLSAAIGFYAREFHLTVRPTVTLPQKPPSPRDALTREQAARLLKASLGYRRQQDGSWKRLQESSRLNRAHLRRFLLIGIYTGTRPGLIPRLLWTETPDAPWVDLDRGVIYRKGRDERESRTKRKPMVLVPVRLLAHLRRWRRLDEAEEKRREEKTGSSVPIISVIHHGGEPLAGRVRRGFAGIVADAGLEGEITPHWMRHTCATWLMEGGVELWGAAAFTGMTVQTLERNYGHHRPDHQAAARRALGGKRVIGEAPSDWRTLWKTSTRNGSQ